MFYVASIRGEEPPSTPAAQLVEKASRLLLLVEKASRLLLLILCVSPIALFPVALAIRAYGYLFP